MIRSFRDSLRGGSSNDSGFRGGEPICSAKRTASFSFWMRLAPWRTYEAPGNRLERLRGDRAGQHSIRINDQWRVCFAWRSDGPHDVEICDYH